MFPAIDMYELIADIRPSMILGNKSLRFLGTLGHMYPFPCPSLRPCSLAWLYCVFVFLLICVPSAVKATVCCCTQYLALGPYVEVGPCLRFVQVG